MSDQGNAWKCSVCGYVSETEAPPEKCPVCGVPREKFEAFVSAAPKTAKPALWQCMVCNHNHAGETPPEKCPVCGVSGEKFESITGSSGANGNGNSDKIVIVGGGIAGLAAAEAIRALSSSAEISIVSREKELPYYRLNLTRYIAGEIESDILPMHPENWYKEKNISIMTECEVVDIKAKEQCVVLRDGKQIDYDKVILTAGSHPFVPSVPGAGLEGVTALRFVEDAGYIISAAEKAESVVIIGGGVLGLEAAGALAARKKGLAITVVEGFEYLMPRQLNKNAAAYLTRYLERLGMDIVTGTSVREIKGDGHVKEVVLGNGKIIPADMVIFSVGVRPNSYLAKSCNLKVNQGIIVNDNMETSVPGIFAAGDIAEHRGVLYGLWNAAMFQGKIAGMNAAGKKTDFGGIPRSNTLKVLDVDLFSIGSFNACDGSCRFVEHKTEETYAFYLFRDGKIEGVVLFGDTSQSALVKTAVEDKINLPMSLIEKRDLNEILGFLSRQI